MKAIVNSTDLNRAISATRDFVRKDLNRLFRAYIRLEFNAADACMTAMAVNGFMMSVEHVPCTCDEDLVTYIHPYIKLPNKKPVTIEVTEAETLIRCEDIIFGCPRIAGEDNFDWRKALPAEPEFKIAFNARYLRTTLNAAAVSLGSGSKAPVILEFRGPTEPVILRTKRPNQSDDIKMVMPVRIRMN